MRKIFITLAMMMLLGTSDLFAQEITPGKEIDLGLPSGTIWAGWNVGATSPEEYGDYYAWDENMPKKDYSQETYEYGFVSDSIGYDKYYMINIGIDIGTTKYDVARQKWGNLWQIPTINDLYELASKCTWTWYQYKGVWGMKVVGPNGNAVFFPAAGYRSGTSFKGEDYGVYWTSTLYKGNEEDLVMGLAFGDSGADICGYKRFDGHSVRPVYHIVSKKEHEITTGKEIDLGLPSGTIWAGWNVGATSPEEYGDYYAWGETATKEDYSEATYKYYNKETDEFINNVSNISGTQYDVAREKWGGSWRMPTELELEELVEKCRWIWITNKDVNGYKVIGPNGNSIFLPAAGCRDGTSLSNEGCYGIYGCATLHESFGYYSYGGGLRFFFGTYYSGYNCYRCYGYPVRPVK